MFENLDRTEIDDFKPKGELNPEFWHNGILDSRVRLKLMDLADDFIDTLNIRWVKPEDVVVTGSMANYNWNDFSDVDVHVIMNYSKVYKDKDFVKSYFDAKKNLWKEEHPRLKVFGFPVEMYVEDAKNPSKAGGVYSLNKNEWVTEPKEMDAEDVDYDKIERKAVDIMDNVDELVGKLKNERDLKKCDVVSRKLDKLFDKLKSERKKALATKERELSPWNIIWKVLRAEGYLDKIVNAINRNYDKQNSVNEHKVAIMTEEQFNKNFIDNGVRTYYKGSVPDDTKHIKTGNTFWDSQFFVSKNKEDASLYGSNIRVFKTKPCTKIATEEQMNLKQKMGENLLNYCIRVLNKAIDLGYDVIEFKKQGDVGTVIINRNCIYEVV